ncbi:hypothetical protein MMC18_008113 [Xylographa bjoerkii]|nr:hypothetical protein [Xylographa bjoerkii]
MNPTILFVPGFWEGAAPFARVSALLQAEGYRTEIAVLPSTGTVSPSNPSMEDDIAAVRATVEKLVMVGNDVVMVMHSAGGFLGSNAIEGLSANARVEKGLKGGVTHIVFLCAGVYPVGFTHEPLPFFVIDGGALNCAMPEKLLFSDLDQRAATEWTAKLQTQPAEGWFGTVTYCGWKDVPSVYLVCEGDALIPPPMQVQLAESAGSRIEKCSAGHMVMETIKGLDHSRTKIAMLHLLRVEEEKTIRTMTRPASQTSAGGNIEPQIITGSGIMVVDALSAAKSGAIDERNPELTDVKPTKRGSTGVVDKILTSKSG